MERTCRTCGYEEEHWYNYGRGGDDVKMGGLVGDFKDLGNGLKACPSCGDVTYEEK